MVNRTLEIVGAVVLFYGGLYTLLATIGLVAYLIRRALRRDGNSTRAVACLMLASGKTTAPMGKFQRRRRGPADTCAPSTT